MSTSLQTSGAAAIPVGRFPLLAKELMELANRRRTYVVRFLYTAALFAGGLLILYGQGGIAADSAARLGEGRRMFLRLVWLQFAGIYLFLPAMSAGALTAEKERDTLTLLLLTPITPWEILLQKLLSRVIPMLCFVILSFPLMAVAYGYGGVTTSGLYAAMVLLVLAVFQVASVALMCSAYCRTTTEAFLACNAILAVAYFCMPAFVPLAAVWHDVNFRPGELETHVTLVGFTILGALFAARTFLISRAFVPPRNVLLQFFQALDQLYQDMNVVTGGVILVRDGGLLPDDRPVAWRETAKKSLGTFRYLFRVLVVLELPILFVAQGINISAIRSQSATTYLLDLLWVVATAMVCVHAASVVSAERSRQTWDSLLTTPIPGRELLRQKLAGVQRLVNVLLIPFCTLYLFHHWLRDYRYDLTYLVLSIASAVIFLRLTVWAAFLVGLSMRSQMKAAFTSLAAVALLVSLPDLITTLTFSLGLPLPAWGQQMLSAGPASLILRLETWYLLTGGPDEYQLRKLTIMLGLSLAGYALALWGIRSICLRNADRLLGRMVAPPAGRWEHRPDSRDVPVTNS